MTTTGRTILVVDDDARVADLAARALAAEGHAVTVAESAVAALALADCGRFDLVLSDFSMPGGDGLSLLRALAPLQPRAHRVLWSASVPASVVRAAARIGVPVLERKLIGTDLQSFARAVFTELSDGARMPWTRRVHPAAG